VKTGNIISRWTASMVLVGLIIFLVVSVPAEMVRSEEPPRNGAAGLKIGNEDFAFVPGKAMLVEGRYVFALYESAEKEHYALVLFAANCDPDCKVGELVAYSVFDGHGDDVQLANDLQAESRKILQAAFTACAQEADC
jgi:hypothetical protein